MKKLLLTTTLFGLFMGCIMQEEDCLDDNSCGDNQQSVQPVDSVPVDSIIVDTTMACYEIYAPVCAAGVTYSNDCFAEAAGHSDYEEGSCDNPVDSVVVCPAHLTIAPECGINEELVYVEYEVQLDYSKQSAQSSRAPDSDVGPGTIEPVIPIDQCNRGGYQCVPIEGCQEVADPSLIDCQEGSELRLVRDEAGCSDYQCVDTNSGNTQCYDYWKAEQPDEEKIIIYQPNGSDVEVQPVDDTCEPIFDQNGCVIEYDCPIREVVY